MKKNYYEILEVDKNASDEIIEKAYKILAKRYHPDLQDEEKRKIYEEKMKQINEAYSILSDENEKKIYDEKLNSTSVSLEEYEILVKENNNLRNEINRLNQMQKKYNTISQNPVNIRQSNNYQRTYNEQINRVQKNASNEQKPQTTNNSENKIKEYMKTFVSIICVILFIILIAQIPFVRKIFINLYEKNILIKLIVDTLKNTFQAIFKF